MTPPCNVNPYSMMTDAESQSIFVLYSGTMSSELNSSIIKHIETQLNAFSDPFLLRKRVINIVIEALQNMYHHQHKATSNSDWQSSSTLILGRTSNGYFVKTGNYVRSEAEPNLDERLKQLENLSEKELRKLHVAALKDGSRTNKGAGLGLIDMARRSNNNIKHELISITNKLSFFSLNIEINP